jgi:hypothetical protein
VLYNPRTKLNPLKKHVDVEHNLLAKKFNEEVNSSRRTQVERQPTKKRKNVSSSKFF